MQMLVCQCTGQLRAVRVVISRAHPLCRRHRRPAVFTNTTAAAAAASTMAAAAAADTPPPPELRLAGPGGWAVRAAAGCGGVRVIAVVDGPNIAVRCARAAHGDPSAAEARFRAWLAYLRQALAPAATVVAFDNVQSAASGARSAIWPAYKRRRAAPGGRGGGGGPALAGWAHLDGACRAVGAIPVHASVGYEADDVIAAVAEWLRALETSPPQQPQPQPDPGPSTSTTHATLAAVVVSGDADVQQALCPQTLWLELLQAPARRGAASALRLATAAEFEAAHGYPPSAHACFLALAGKQETGVPGTGLSDRTAKGLAARYAGDLEAVLSAAAASALAPATAARLLPGPGADAARRNWQLLRLAAEAQAAPLAALAAELRRSEALEAGQTVPAAEPSHEQVTALARAHPSVGGRWALLSAPLARVSSALARSALPHAERWVCPRSGAPLDAVARAYDGRGRLLPALLPAGAETRGDPSVVEAEGAALAGSFSPADSVALMVLSSGDLADLPGGRAAAPGASQAATAAAIAALPARLARLLSPGAKRRLSFLRACGWRVALLPVAAGGGGGGGGEDDVAFEARLLAAIVSA